MPEEDFYLFFMIKKPTQISISTDFITLGQFLKLADIISTGGEAKTFLANNSIKVNNEPDNRRGRKLRGGDKIEIKSSVYEIIKK